MLTKSDLNEIKKLLKGFTTKDDLKGLATKADLKGFATKDDLIGLANKDDLKKYATKDDLKNTEKVLRNDIVQFKDDILHELVKIRDDLDIVTGYRGLIADNEERIEKLEDKVYAA